MMNAGVKRVDTTIRIAKASYYGVPPKEILTRLEEAEGLAAALPGPDGTPGGDRLRLAQIHYYMGFNHFSANRMREAVGYYSKVLAVAADLKAPELLDMPSFSIGMVLVIPGTPGKGATPARPGDHGS